MFLDDDIVCEPDVFRLHVEAHAGEESLVVHGAIYQAPGLSPSILGNANVDWYLRYNSRLASHGGAIWPEGVFLISNSSIPGSYCLIVAGSTKTCLQWMTSSWDLDCGNRKSLSNIFQTLLPMSSQ